MKMIRGVGLALVVLLGGVSCAQAPQQPQEPDLAKPFELYGAGSLLCASWTEARETGNEAQLNLFRQWVAGWFVSYNYFSARTQQDTVPSPDFDAISAWLDTYCRNNPNDAVVFGAVALVEQRGGMKSLHAWKK